ncbi:hypothetical protein [Azospirillum doebereinerae]|uniref:Uncharacterized protein n=1 Tax=Azospirillum doebereinerae TaxID=92933 RepID=A0A433J059_9PROT|nr:hypothetical protein [Azospirillum doebereinerae]RUQ62057.1 hypothetical protein EJ913_29020 [Azospirillum doebereinerae]
MTPSDPPSPAVPPAAVASAAGRLFRPAALDRLATPEDLDRPATLASPRGRWWCLGLAALCLTAAVGLIVV